MNSTHPIPPKKGPGLEAAGGERVDADIVVEAPHKIKPVIRAWREFSSALDELREFAGERRRGAR